MSSIRDEAFNLCKSVWLSPSVADLRSAYQNIHSTWFEFHIRKFDAQFLAYLLLDEQLDVLNQQLSEPIPHLLPDERDLLINAHQQIVELNNQCLAPVRDKFPPLTAFSYMPALDPYNLLRTELPPPTTAATFLTAEAMEIMAKTFHNHPAINAALENQPAYADHALTRIIEQGETGPNTTVQVLDWTRLLTSKGATDPDSELTRLVFAPKNSPSRAPARFITALASLRTSLASLNQLVYQATLTNKLPALDDDNVIDLRVSSNFISTLADVVFQKSDKLQLAINGQLVRIKVPDQADMLARTESWAIDIADNTIEAVLREVNEDLNLFGPLLRNI